MSAKRKVESKQQDDHVSKAAKTTQPSTAPMSAIAARRAAMKSGLYKPEPEIEDEEEVVPTNHLADEQLSDAEGVELASFTGEEDDVEDERAKYNDDTMITPLSRSTTPTEAYQSSPMMSSSTKRIPPLLDFKSVSRFIPTNDNTYAIEFDDRRYLFVGLRKGEYITFMGQVLVAPLYGSISIAGAVISSRRATPTQKGESPSSNLSVSFYPVYSPRTHSVLSIHSESLDSPSILYTSDDIFELDDDLIDAVMDGLRGMSEFESVFILRDMDSECTIENLRNCVPCSSKNLVHFMRNEIVSQQCKNNGTNSASVAHLTNFGNGRAANDKTLEGFHAIFQHPIPGVKAFKVELNWEVQTTQAMKNASEHEQAPVSLICGAKDMGKSSFARYYINRLLTKYKRVAYLETDVGQSEFTPAGLLSLHYITQPILGPPYTHQHLEAVRSFFFGSTSCRHDPEYYLACIFELMDHWRQDQNKVLKSDVIKEDEFIPLVVNTQGWISGEGYNLLINQIQHLRPTDVFALRHFMLSYRNLPPSFEVDILPQVADTTMPSMQGYGKAPILHHLDCVLHDQNVTTLADNFTSVHLREMALGSYFLQTNMGNSTLPGWNFKEHIVDRVPWVVDWRQNLNEVWIMSEEVNHNELLYALNGSLVGLIGDMEDYQPLPGPNNLIKNEDTFTPPKYYHTADQPAPDPHKKTCYGLAIVRAIDPEHHALLLVTPLPLDTLKRVSGIVKGEMQLPLWGMLDHKLEKGMGVANVPWKKVPYITQEHTEGAGANALRVRRNLLRKSQS